MAILPTSRTVPQAKDIAVITAASLKIGSAAREDLDSVIQKIDTAINTEAGTRSTADSTLQGNIDLAWNAILKLLEDRNALLTGGGAITNTGGTSLAFTSNFVLYLNSNIAGAAPYALSINSSPWAFTTDGNMAYITITSRSAGTFSLTTDASTEPAVTTSNQEVFLIAKRVGTSIFLRDGTVIASGSTVTLGQTAAGGSDKQIQYNASGVLAGNTNFVYDYTTARVGIGTTAPSTKLHIGGSGSNVLTINSSTAATDCGIELGSGGSGNRNMYMDFVGDDTYTDYGLRFIRHSGANAPSEIIHRGTGNLYLSGVEASQIILQTANTNRLIIDGSGNVGIGTAAPLTRLTVYGTGETTTISDAGDKSGTIRVTTTGGNGGDGGVIEFGAGHGSYTQSYFSAIKGLLTNGANNTTGSLGFYTRNASTDSSLTQRMLITDTGNVGIGTASPSSPLHIYHATSATSLLEGDATTLQYITRHSTNSSAPDLNFRKSRGTTASPTTVATGDAMGRILFSAYGGTNWRDLALIRSAVDTYTSDTDISSHMTFWTTPTGSVTAVERMRIDPSGNVGIGGAPSQKFQVTGTGFVSAQITGDSTSETQLRFTANTVARISNQANTALIFDTNAAERMRIDNAGNVGIGYTGSGASKLNLMDNTGGVNPIISIYNSASAERVRFSYDDDNLRLHIGVGASPATASMTFDSAGNVGIGLTPTSRNNTTLQIKDGIGFPATQVASTDVNTLDDYEEGTWTPSVGGTATYTTQVGSYTKIGNKVFFQGKLEINVIGTGSQSFVFGLPFTSSASEPFGSVHISYYSGLAASYVNITGVLGSSSTNFALCGATAAASSLSSVNALTSGAQVRFAGFYTV